MTGLPIQEGLSAPNRVVNAYLAAEQVEGGILEDIKTIIPTYKSESSKDPPCIWIHEHPTVVDQRQVVNLSMTQMMVTPFEFVCIEYDKDLDIAAELARNLATRVGASILKHFNRVKTLPNDPDRIFQTIRFEQFIPDGEVPITGKSDSVPASALILDFVYPIQWMYCAKV